MSNPLTILLVHNHYQQRGGEDSVFETECAMLRGAGHTVICYEKHNDEIGSGEKRLAASGQRLESEEAKGSGFRVQEGKASSRALSQALSKLETENVGGFVVNSAGQSFGLLNPGARSLGSSTDAATTRRPFEWRSHSPQSAQRCGGRQCIAVFGQPVVAGLILCRRRCYRRGPSTDSWQATPHKRRLFPEEDLRSI